MIRRFPGGRNTGVAESVRRWWFQRLSAVALLPLTPWFVYDLATLDTLEYAAVREWLASPATAILFILLIPALFYHALLGMEEIIEDYAAQGWRKTAAVTLTRLIAALCALASMLAVMAVTLGM